MTGTYSVYFSTTSKAVNGLSTTYAANLGTNNSLFATGVFSSLGNTLTFTAANAFTYDPSMGNLLLDFFSNGSTGDVAAFKGGGSLDTSRVYNYGGNGDVTPTADIFGLYTSFTYADATSVTPEPSGLVLVGTGCSALIGLMRRREQL